MMDFVRHVIRSSERSATPLERALGERALGNLAWASARQPCLGERSLSGVRQINTLGLSERSATSLERALGDLTRVFPVGSFEVPAWLERALGSERSATSLGRALGNPAWASARSATCDEAWPPLSAFSSVRKLHFL